MPSSILAKYSPEIIFGETTPIAITDSELKITWFNNSFKENFPDHKLKGKTLTSLLSSIGIEKEIEPVYKKPARRRLRQEYYPYYPPFPLRHRS